MKQYEKGTRTINRALYQEFPKTDPLEIERIIKRVKQWLEQKHEYYEKLGNKIAKKLGEKAIETYVSKAYPHCIDALLQDLNLSK